MVQNSSLVEWLVIQVITWIANLKFVIQGVAWITKLIIRYSGHGLNNKLLAGIWIANKEKFRYSGVSTMQIATVLD